MTLTPLGTSQKWGHAVSVLLCLADLSEHHVLKRHQPLHCFLGSRNPESQRITILSSSCSGLSFRTMTTLPQLPQCKFTRSSRQLTLQRSWARGVREARGLLPHRSRGGGRTRGAPAWAPGWALSQGPCCLPRKDGFNSAESVIGSSGLGLSHAEDSGLLGPAR